MTEKFQNFINVPKEQVLWFKFLNIPEQVFRTVRDQTKDGADYVILIPLVDFSALAQWGGVENSSETALRRNSRYLYRVNSNQRAKVWIDGLAELKRNTWVSLSCKWELMALLCHILDNWEEWSDLSRPIGTSQRPIEISGQQLHSRRGQELSALGRGTVIRVEKSVDMSETAVLKRQVDRLERRVTELETRLARLRKV